MSYRLLIHGGAGAMRSMSSSAELAYRKGLTDSVSAGQQILRSGRTARAAVLAAVRVMETSEAFNAGRGSALSMNGTIEADAAIMDGETLDTGAIAAVPNVTNAVALAEAVLERSAHCLLAGSSVLDWAASEALDVETFPVPQTRKAQWESRLEQLNGNTDVRNLVDMGGTHDLGDTVGAIALDENGRLAVAVSTGGIWMKANGRVGDSPLVGAGIWADSTSGAACATGTGEFIIRSMLVSRISIAMEQGRTATESARQGLDWLKSRFGGGKAGVIAIDRQGIMSAPFDTAGMGRGWISETMAEPVVAIWPEDQML